MIRLLNNRDAQNLDLVRVLVFNINKNYSETEKEFWKDGVERTTLERFQTEILNNHVLVYFDDHNPVGTVKYAIEDKDAMFGMLSVNLDQHGKRIGSQLYRQMEDNLMDQGVQNLHLELLVPRHYTSEYKDYIYNWYLRNGFELRDRKRTEDLDYFPSENLIIESDFLFMTKNLS